MLGAFFTESLQDLSSADALRVTYSAVRSSLDLMRILVAMALATLVSCEPEGPKSWARAAEAIRPPGDILWLSKLSEARFVSSKGFARVPDSKIKYDIEARMQGSFLRDARIKVQVQDQNVVLTGTAPSGAQIEAVEAQAWRVLGVANVVNHVVTP